MKQRTLSSPCSFEGKGLHTGAFGHARVLPASENTGIVFVRTDLGGETISALAENICDTSRSTTISNGKAEVHTIEHLMSALTGMGIDNAIIETDSLEIPILNGSALPFVEAFTKAGIVEQKAVRKYLTPKKEIYVEDPKSGASLKNRTG